MVYSIFSKNVPYDDQSSLRNSPGKGGCLHATGYIIILKFDQFSGNQKGSGGALSFNSLSSLTNLILISDCMFFDNYALYGGAIYLHSDYKINFFIQKCNFQRNWGFKV